MNFSWALEFHPETCADSDSEFLSLRREFRKVSDDPTQERLKTMRDQVYQLNLNIRII